MRIAIVTSLWGRASLTKTFLEYYNEMRVDGVELALVAVYSEEDKQFDDAWKDDFDKWFFVEHNNESLTDKFRVGVDVVEAVNPGGVIILDSDGFISPEYIGTCARKIRQGYSYLVPQSIYFLDQPTERMCYCESAKVGSGRALSRGLLMALEWNPFDSVCKFAQDRAMNVRLRGFVPHYLKGESLALLDVKTPENRNTYDYVYSKRAVKSVDARTKLGELWNGLEQKLLSSCDIYT